MRAVRLSPPACRLVLAAIVVPISHLLLWRHSTPCAMANRSLSGATPSASRCSTLATRQAMMQSTLQVRGTSRVSFCITQAHQL